MLMFKSTYYFELTKVDLVDKKTHNWKMKFKRFLQNIKVDMVCAMYIKSFSIEALYLIINEYKDLWMLWGSLEGTQRRSIIFTKASR